MRRPLVRLGLLFALVLTLLVAVLLINTLRIGTDMTTPVTPVEVPIDLEAAAARLAGALQFETVSFQDRSSMDAGAFLELHSYLETSFPRVHAALQRETVAELSLLYTWPGADPAVKPALLLAHQDVVPVEEQGLDDWSIAPFAGELRDGFVGGRGALDDKCGLFGILEAVELLLEQGFVPERTHYLAFGHDEEVGGVEGAAVIAELLESRGVEIEYLIDEGGMFLEGLAPGVSGPVAAIGIAEKGYLSVELTVESPGGHSSNPPPETSVTILANAIHRLSENPFEARMTDPGREFLIRIAPRLPFLQRMAIANLWLTEPMVTRTTESDRVASASVRTTMAPTIFNAGVKDNVLPKRARAVVNLRILPGDTVAGVLEHLERVVDDDRVSLVPAGFGQEPSAVSSFSTTAYRGLERSIRRALPREDLIVTPFLLLGGTDSRHYTSLTDQVYRFRGLTLSPANVASVQLRGDGEL
jgi:carboxypeptidase PM20D1